MAFCKACGQEIGDAGFCPKCGAAQGAATVPVVTSSGASDSPSAGMEENVAGCLAYLFGWITGLIFLLIDKRQFVKFHAAQSIALNIAFVAVWFAFWIVVLILGFITALLHFPIGFLLGLLFPVIGLGFLAIVIFCMYKAYQHEKFKLPVIGNMVEGMINK